MDSSAPQRAIVVDDDDFLRLMLARTLKGMEFSEVIDCSSAAAGIKVAKEKEFSLAVLDLDLGAGPNGIDLAHALRKAHPAIAIAILSTYRDPRLLGTDRELPDGAIYLSKRDLDDLDQLEDDLRAVLETPRGRRDGAPETRIAGRKLSDNQIAVMRLVAEGYSNAEIAKRRHLTQPAVEKAVARLVKQLELNPGEADNVRVLIAQAYVQLSGTSEIRRT
jgi:DNA-binding NarL/FixJ family response regulator